jgi:hypothetical protein
MILEQMFDLERQQLSIIEAGMSVGYSYGLRNYLRDYVGGKNGEFSRFIRFGLAYRIR